MVLKFFELVPHHAGDVQVSEFSFGRFGDFVVAGIKLRGLGQSAGRGVAGGANGDLAGFLVVLALDGEDDVAIKAAVESLRE